VSYLTYDYDVVRWATMECQRQHTDPNGVWRMIQAWDFTMTCVAGSPFAESDIVWIAGIVEPQNHGYRTTPVSFPNGNFAMNAANVPRAMDMLYAHGDRTNPDAFVKEFLDIHPFEDGNGRTASIMYNLLRGTMSNPRMLPYYYEDE